MSTHPSTVRPVLLKRGKKNRVRFLFQLSGFKQLTNITTGVFFFDVQVTEPTGCSPLATKQTTLDNSSIPLREADSAYKDKMDKSAEFCRQQGITFHGIIHETSGAKHKVAAVLMAAVAKYAVMEQKWHGKEDAFVSYWGKRISCAIQRGVSHSIISKARDINSGGARYLQRKINRSYITEHAEPIRRQVDSGGRCGH